MRENPTRLLPNYFSAQKKRRAEANDSGEFAAQKRLKTFQSYQVHGFEPRAHSNNKNHASAAAAYPRHIGVGIAASMFPEHLASYISGESKSRRHRVAAAYLSDEPAKQQRVGVGVEVVRLTQTPSPFFAIRRPEGAGGDRLALARPGQIYPMIPAALPSMQAFEARPPQPRHVHHVRAGGATPLYLVRDELGRPELEPLENARIRQPQQPQQPPVQRVQVQAMPAKPIPAFQRTQRTPVPVLSVRDDRTEQRKVEALTSYCSHALEAMRSAAEEKFRGAGEQRRDLQTAARIEALASQALQTTTSANKGPGLEPGQDLSAVKRGLPLPCSRKPSGHIDDGGARGGVKPGACHDKAAAEDEAPKKKRRAPRDPIKTAARKAKRQEKAMEKKEWVLLGKAARIVQGANLQRAKAKGRGLGGTSAPVRRAVRRALILINKHVKVEREAAVDGERLLYRGNSCRLATERHPSLLHFNIKTVGGRRSCLACTLLWDAKKEASRSEKDLTACWEKTLGGEGGGKAITSCNDGGYTSQELYWHDNLKCCGREYEEGEACVMCDTCKRWFHCECIDMELDELEKVDTYECQGCEKQRLRAIQRAEVQAERAREKEEQAAKKTAMKAAKAKAKKGQRARGAKGLKFAKGDIEYPIEGIRFTGYGYCRYEGWDRKSPRHLGVMSPKKAKELFQDDPEGAYLGLEKLALKGNEYNAYVYYLPPGKSNDGGAESGTRFPEGFCLKGAGKKCKERKSFVTFEKVETEVKGCPCSGCYAKCDTNEELVYHWLWCQRRPDVTSDIKHIKLESLTGPKSKGSSLCGHGKTKMDRKALREVTRVHTLARKLKSSDKIKMVRVHSLVLQNLERVFAHSKNSLNVLAQALKPECPLFGGVLPCSRIGESVSTGKINKAFQWAIVSLPRIYYRLRDKFEEMAHAKGSGDVLDVTSLLQRLEKQCRVLSEPGEYSTKLFQRLSPEPCHFFCTTCSACSLTSSSCSNCGSADGLCQEICGSKCPRNSVPGDRAKESVKTSSAQDPSANSPKKEKDCTPKKKPQKKIKNVNTKPASRNSWEELVPKRNASVIRAFRYSEVIVSKLKPEKFMFHAGDIIFLYRNAMWLTKGDVNKAARKAIKCWIDRWDKSVSITGDSQIEYVMGYVECLHAKAEIGRLLPGCESKPKYSQKINKALKQHALEDIIRFNPHPFLERGRIIKTPKQYCYSCGGFQEVFKVCPTCHSDLHAVPDYDAMCEATVWTSVFEDIGVPVSACDGVAKLIHVLPLVKLLRPYRSLPQLGRDLFRLQCYFITHLIFILGAWGRRSLKPNRILLLEECSFLCLNLETVIRMKDPELVGEFSQALHILGFDASDPNLERSHRFLLNCETKSCWASPRHQFYRKYHSAYCGIIGLAEFSFEDGNVLPNELIEAFQRELTESKDEDDGEEEED
mmetsp:Transcript_4878/g.11671  ORF Transcript_4878/g.11671 Transcript_4878/m.11671 type:complete len:1428 (-) Transcript_4878:198-4481(-)